MMNKYVTLLPALLAASIVQANDALGLPDTVVTASRIEQPIDQTLASTTIFTRQDIERLQPKTVIDLLERVPGLSVAPTGGRGSQTGLFLRGTNSNQTLVLIDGQRISNASAGTASLEFISLEQIERIEVVRGPRSAVYGSDAIGGVIQIFTRRGSEGLNPRARFGIGTEHTFERHLGVSGGNQQTIFDLGATLIETRGIDHTMGGLPNDSDRDAYRNRTFTGNLQHNLTDAMKIGIQASTSEGKVEVDLGAEQVDFTVSSISNFLEATVSERWTSKLEAGYAEEKRFTEGFNDITNTYRDSASWLNTIELDPRHQLVAGLDWYRDKVRSSTPYDETDRTNQAVFGQYHFTGDRYAAELGMRHDDNEQFGSKNTFNTAASYALSTNQSLILSYAEGFKAPTFNDLYYPGFGNPDLEPESSQSYEAQWRGKHSLLNWNLSAFRSDVEDLISGGRNINRARINGVELELGSSYAGWDYNLAATILDPRNRDTGSVLPRRPKRSLSLDIDRYINAFSLGAGWQLNSRRYDSNGEEWLSGYGTLDLRGSWQQSSELRWNLRISNVLDKEYSRTNDFFGESYREEGRTAMLSVNWSPSL